MSLSERLRPGIECAGWVIEEVKAYEDQIALLLKEKEEQDAARSFDEILISDLRERVKELEVFVIEYGDHSSTCRSRDEYERSCNCGYPAQMEKALGGGKGEG